MKSVISYQMVFIPQCYEYLPWTKAYLHAYLANRYVGTYLGILSFLNTKLPSWATLECNKIFLYCEREVISVTELEQ